MTHDGGESWNPTAPLAPEGNKGLVRNFADARHGFATNGDRLYRTTDGGRNWAKITPYPDLVGVRQLTFVNGKTGWALVSEAGSTKTRLLKTADGGSTRKPVTPGLASKEFTRTGEVKGELEQLYKNPGSVSRRIAAFKRDSQSLFSIAC
ncbi:WD40/YVTN/BNR-like repeat-containing protein [Desulfofundulus thermosubterraneus]|uniref:Photosynthesis system II assembly factor Ycf48/Hcf136-like domain-containing protein n=1 Tax=Desulfofundulus thermosubterraneus DSM 16057 TaxID=1121432 RepID=A0A1M6AN41_9FIRM|nr:hypothetical protein [Desulfofundulus thermosubterraneus]SHI37613.1 hypothetical protein SAMN02745219_00201 [Desulfofundulus thermosubterraneus DSM 16057]